MSAHDITSFAQETAVGNFRLDAQSPPTYTAIASTASVPQIEEDCLRLRELLRDINASVGDGAFFHQHRHHGVDLLKGLSRQVAVHFALEETGNCFADPEAVALELAGLADALRSEHRALAAEIDNVVEQAESLIAGAAESESEQRRIVSRVRVFCHRLRDHERRENELLLQAYADDVGVGD
jgi:Hemerythrin HHE cation binding domain